jgi:hypothetical protein
LKTRPFLLCNCGLKQDDSIADFSLKDSANSNHALAVGQRIKVTIRSTATVMLLQQSAALFGAPK